MYEKHNYVYVCNVGRTNLSKSLIFVVPKYDDGNGTIKKSLLNDFAADTKIEHFKSQACKSFCNNCTIDSRFSFTDISIFF